MALVDEGPERRDSTITRSKTAVQSGHPSFQNVTRRGKAKPVRRSRQPYNEQLPVAAAATPPHSVTTFHVLEPSPSNSPCRKRDNLHRENSRQTINQRPPDNARYDLRSTDVHYPPAVVPQGQGYQDGEYAWGRIIALAVLNHLKSCHNDGRWPQSLTGPEADQLILDAFFSLTQHHHDVSACDQEGSSSQAEGGAGPSWSQESQASIPGSSARKATKRRGDKPPNRDGKRQRQDPASPQIVNREPNQSFACPFAVYDPRTYECQQLLKRVSDVRQHILRKHLQKLFCPQCGIPFEPNNSDSERAREEHIVERSCRRAAAPIYYPGATPDQWHAICTSRDQQVRGSEVERWFIIWDILFSGYPRPSSPYITTAASAFLRRLDQLVNRFWEQDRGRAIVRQLLLPATHSPPGTHEALHRNIELFMQTFQSFAEENEAISQGNNNAPMVTGIGITSRHSLQRLPSTVGHTHDYFVSSDNFDAPLPDYHSPSIFPRAPSTSTASLPYPDVSDTLMPPDLMSYPSPSTLLDELHSPNSHMYEEAEDTE